MKTREVNRIVQGYQTTDGADVLLAGKPLKEPIAWGGPIVMNTKDELQAAFSELEQGTFIKHD